MLQLHYCLFFSQCVRDFNSLCSGFQHIFRPELLIYLGGRSFTVSSYIQAGSRIFTQEFSYILMKAVKVTVLLENS